MILRVHPFLFPLLPGRTTEVLNPIKNKSEGPNSQASVPPQLMADIGETIQVSSLKGQWLWG